MIPRILELERTSVSRKAFFRTEILMRILVYKTSEKITLAPHLGLAFPLGDPQRTLRPMV